MNKKNIKISVQMIFMLFCVLFAFAGCRNTYSDEEDYRNFVKWQTRYETEKELISLLRDYDVAYKAYSDYIEKAPGYSSPNIDSITFEFEGRTVLTDENITLVQTRYNQESDDHVIIFTFDSIGTDILADLTTNHTGGIIYIVENRNDASFILNQVTIHDAITDGVAIITGSTGSDAPQLYMHISAKTAERSVQLAATAYNNKCSETGVRHAMPEYLPASLSVTPEYTDATTYLQKAKAVGFIV